MPPEICLVMIVRDEAQVIERCLESVRSLITHWCIVDTGSKDATGDIIERRLADLPGRLHHRRWVDFGHNRSEALALAADQGDYLLLIDADEVLRIEPDFFLPDDPAVQAWQIRQIHRNTELEFYLPRLLRSDHPWHFEGVLHEYLASTQTYRKEPVAGLIQFGHFDSARNQRPQRDKYLDDARVLKQALEKDPDNARYQFYLAQSLRDAGESDQAIEAYRRRSDMGGWDEEVFYSLFSIARLLEQDAARATETTAAYLQAWQYRPTRAEPLVELARLHRQRREFHLACLFADKAEAMVLPDDVLFLDAGVYRWRARDELSTACFGTGQVERALSLTEELLNGSTLPDSERIRVERNRDACLARLRNKCVTYPATRIEAMGSEAIQKPSTAPRIALTITTCKRLALFEQTINSFLHCCLDHALISEWICIDDNSSATDRARMKARYPFFTFVWKDEKTIGHAASMNLIIDLTRAGGFDHVIHLEDDWRFFEQRNYITDSLHVLADEPRFGQVLFNRNYAETLDDQNIIGGLPCTSAKAAVHYRIHEHFPADDNASVTPPGRSCAYWPHYSLRPSLTRTEVFKKVGRFNPASNHFEMDYARRYTSAGFQSVFLDTICSQHIGKLTSEHGENAYTLNNQPQFGNNRTS